MIEALVKESEALAIAKQFAIEENRESKLSIVDGEYEVGFEKDGFGHTVLGLDENYWSITFMLESTESGIKLFDSDSEYFIVLVGAQSGEPHWLPMM